ncbi:MAG: hypothetical protein OEM26_19515 [Saprospiraceae bacterium]|nr:hypothetical protein [Saprospiraceae bacterium]
MKRVLRNLSLLLIMFAISSSCLLAQYVVVQYRSVPQENVGEFLHRETNYWSKVAQKAIDEGKLSSWALWQKVGGWDLPNGSNFMFVNVFAEKAHLDDMGTIWGAASDMFPDLPMSSISTNDLGTTNHQMVLVGVAGEGEGPPNYVRINYAKASDITRYLELEQNTWGPFVKERMESGNTDVKTWRLAQVMMPAGTDLPFNALTADGFDKLSDAMVPAGTFAEGTEFPDLTELNEVHEKVYIQVYALVKSVN